MMQGKPKGHNDLQRYSMVWNDRVRFRNPFDIPRSSLLDQVSRMRANFLRQKNAASHRHRSLQEQGMSPVHTFSDISRWMYVSREQCLDLIWVKADPHLISCVYVYMYVFYSDSSIIQAKATWHYECYINLYNGGTRINCCVVCCPRYTGHQTCASCCTR